MYELIYAPDAFRQLQKLPKEVQQRIITALERCRIRPEHYLQRLVGNPHYRLRVGEYRIIVDINQGKLLILVLTVGHRKNIYG